MIMKTKPGFSSTILGHRFILLSWVLVVFCWPLFAQETCPNLPSDSPVLSTSPADIPASGQQVLTYTGSYAPLHANINMSFVQMGPNEQRVWFGLDGNAGLFFNRRYRADGNSPWYWQYSVSQPVGGTDGNSATAVLYSATPKYVDARTGTTYEFLAYQIGQPAACDNQVGGFIEIAFSHNGICWTASRPMVSGGPNYPCAPNLFAPLAAEQVTAIDTGVYVMIVTVEGDLAKLVPSDWFARMTAMNRTQTYIGYANYSDPWNYRPINRVPGELSASGIFSPAFAFDWNGPRYQPYNYFINLQMAWDAGNGDFYIGRGYPYPFDRGSRNQYDQPTTNATPLVSQSANTYLNDPNTGMPTLVGGCKSGPGLLPNRIQIYKMHIGSLDNILQLTTGTWTLVADYGHDSGYGNTLNGYVATTPLMAGQTNRSRDWGAISFLHDTQGFLVRDPSGSYAFGSDTFEYSKSHGPCYVTGLETQSLLALP
ncbi:MAG TPA: hypothetical protein VEZ11_07390 [Thermoanaerobaculia bacterium]|nr:hypothetical protein [Thermoanaerobaculia bacterium]